MYISQFIYVSFYFSQEFFVVLRVQVLYISSQIYSGIFHISDAIENSIDYIFDSSLLVYKNSTWFLYIERVSCHFAKLN